MDRKWCEMGLLAFALSLGGAVVAAPLETVLLVKADAPSVANASPEKKSGRSDAASQGKARPTLGQLAQPGVVVIPPPILRNEGKTVSAPDRPLLGRINLRNLHEPLVAQPPAMPSEPEAALSNDGDIAGVPRRAHF